MKKHIALIILFFAGLSLTAQRVDLFPSVDELDPDLYMWILDPSSSPQSKKVTIQEFDDRYRSYGANTEVPSTSVTQDGFNYFSNFKYNGSDLSVGSGLINDDNTSETIISGGNTTFSGANITLYGSSHATNASDILFKDNNITEILEYDASEILWDFKNTTVEVLQLSLIDGIINDDDDDFIYMAGGPTLATGAGIALYAENSAVGADMNFSSANTVIFNYDASESEVIFQSVADVIVKGDLEFESPGTSWTPVLSFGGGSTGITYSVQTGTFYRNGNVVNYSVRITLTSKGTSTGAAVISGLPYDVSATVGEETYFRAAFYVNITDFWFFNANSSDQLQLFMVGSSTALTNADFANNTLIRISGFYFTDDPY